MFHGTNLLETEIRTDFEEFYGENSFCRFFAACTVFGRHSAVI